jgi:hypothetical protein
VEDIHAETSRATNTVRVYEAKIHSCIAGVFIDFIKRAGKAANTNNSSGVSGVVARTLRSLTPNWD